MQETNQPGQALAPGKRLLTGFVVAEFCLITGNLAARACSRAELLPAREIGLIALGSAIPMLIFAIRFFRLLRSDLDEMLQRIVLEGLAFAMLVYIPLAGFYVNARSAGLLRLQLDPPELLLLPSILIVLGMFVSWSRLK